MHFEEERKRRIDARRQIVHDVESKELTFKPQLGEKSLKMQEKLQNKGVYARDPVTRTSVVTVGDNLHSAVSVSTLHATPIVRLHSFNHDRVDFVLFIMPRRCIEVLAQPQHCRLCSRSRWRPTVHCVVLKARLW
jgi:hypothetical protein